MKGSSKNKSTANFSVGCVKIKAVCKMDGAPLLAFYPPVKLKNAQSRDEQITFMCHFRCALDIVCLPRADVR